MCPAGQSPREAQQTKKVGRLEVLQTDQKELHGGARKDNDSDPVTVKSEANIVNPRNVLINKTQINATITGCSI